MNYLCLEGEQVPFSINIMKQKISILPAFLGVKFSLLYCLIIAKSNEWLLFSASYKLEKIENRCIFIANSLLFLLLFWEFASPTLNENANDWDKITSQSLIMIIRLKVSVKICALCASVVSIYRASVVGIKRTSPLFSPSLHSRSCEFAARPAFYISAKCLPTLQQYNLQVLQSPPTYSSAHALYNC
jgi:hypothetical protein